MSKFECTNFNEFYLSFMDGVNDPRIKHFDMPFHQMLLKDKRESTQFMLYSRSYLECARSIRRAHDLSRIGINYILRTYSYSIPMLYNCRHAVELAIKAYLVYNDKTFEHRHTLLYLWGLTGIKDKNVTNFLKFLSELDDNGVKLRYPYNVAKSKTWVNVDLLLQKSESFVRYISNLIGCDSSIAIDADAASDLIEP